MKRIACASLALALAIGLSGLARAQLVKQVYASGLTHPLSFIQDPQNPSIQYAVQQEGLIKVIQNGAVVGTFIDLSSRITSGGERGLLGLAFAPDYAASGRFYVNYTDINGNTQIDRYNRSANPLIADPATRFPVLSVAQPYANHNGGTLRFGPDGMLFIGMGDGGSSYDPGNRAQSPTTLLGKMLRIDPSSDAFPSDTNRNYAIPASNPFPPGNSLGALQEIWAFGYRNPWKFSFDDPARGGTGAMVIGDVGQDTWEEVDYEPAGLGGRNYGWHQREGAHDTGLGGASYLPLVDPITEYDHTVGSSITGGYVYRGVLLGSAYRGRYFFGDFVAGRLWSVLLNVDPVTHLATATDLREHTAELGGGLGNISSIDVDSNGELYLVDYNGRILALSSVPTVVNPTSYSLFRGVYFSGSLSSLLASDNQYLQVRPGFVLSSSEAPVQIVIDGTSPTTAPLRLGFNLEASTSVTNLQQKIELYNFTSGTYVTMDTRSATTTDSSVTVTPVNPGLYVNPSDRKVRARLSWKAVGPVLSYPWTVRADLADWDVIQ